MALTPPPAQQLTIAQDEPGRLLITLSGDIDIATADDLGRQIAAGMEAGTGAAVDVVIDLSGVTFMDTSGIALLIDVANAAASIQLRDPSNQVRRVIEAAGLTSILPMTP